MTGIPKHLKDYKKKLDSFPCLLNKHNLTKNIAAHRHDYLEFSLVIHGRGTETIDGVTHTMEPGTFTFVMPYQVHEIHVPRGEVLTLYNCNFGMELFYGVNEHYGFASFPLDSGDKQSYIRFDEDTYRYVHELLESMEGEYRHDGSWEKEMLLIRLTEVLILYDRCSRQAGAGHRPPSPPGEKINIWSILHYVHRHYRDDLTLSSVSDSFHLNATYLSLLFKKHTGQTFMNHLHELRIRHSCALLQSTELSVVDIAAEVGYGSYNAFTRMFKQVRGVAPSEYRKSYNG
jgi:AraC-like DNA-binding protein